MVHQEIQICLKDVSLGYHQNKIIFSELNLSFERGNLIGLIGNNGVGKSTLLKTICGSLMPLSGSVEIGKSNVANLNREDLSKLISLVLTEKVEGFNLNVFDVVASGRYPYTNYFGELSKTDHTIIEKYMELCGVAHLKNKSVNEVSDGERQKAMIAKALVQQTPIILLDEPTAFLDYSSKNHITTLLKQLAHEENKTIILSSHDLEMLLRNADKALLLDKENGYLFGTPSQLINSAEMKKLTGNITLTI